MAKQTKTKSTDQIFNEMLQNEMQNYYGNMDLSRRRGVAMPDGYTATVRSMSFQDRDGKETLIPTVSNDGRIMSDDEAIAEYERTGQHLGKFDTVKQANRAAKRIHKNEEARLEDMLYNPEQYRSPELQAAIERGRQWQNFNPQSHFDNPNRAQELQDFRNETMYNFARDNGMTGNNQGFSSRDYLNAVDMFDKYMKGETNDTSWSDFFDKHGLKPITRSNLERKYRASWDSDAGKGGGPVPTGEQQAIMQQVAQAQQGGAPVVSNAPVGGGTPAGGGGYVPPKDPPPKAPPTYVPSAEGTTDYYDKAASRAPSGGGAPTGGAPTGGAPTGGAPTGGAPTGVNGGGRDDADWREGGYIRPDAAPQEQNDGDTFGWLAGVGSGVGAGAGMAFARRFPMPEYDVVRRLPPGHNDFYQQPNKSVMIRGARDLANYTAPSAGVGVGTAGLLVGAPLAAAGWGYANRDDQIARIKENFDNEDYYDNYSDFY